MKYLPITFALSLAVFTADAQVDRGGGIFGFGRKKEQINPGLFPDASSTQPVLVSAPASNPAPAPQNTAPTPPPRTSDNIFRGGAPQEIEAVSYVIEDGQKVKSSEKSKKKAGFLGFGKKDKADTASDPSILKPVPTNAYPDPSQAQTVATTDFTPTAPVVVPDAIEKKSNTHRHTPVSKPIQVEPVAQTHEPAKEKKSGFFSFFNRKSSSDTPPPVLTPEPTVADVSTPAPVEISKPKPAPAPKPVEQTAPTPPAADPVPQFAGVETPKKQKSGFSIPNPIKNLKPPSNPIKNLRPIKKEKTIDLTGAETIISNGEIVDAPDDIVETNIVNTESGTREPPRLVNGVKTYSSWDDVGGRSVSAADKILSQIR